MAKYMVNEVGTKMAEDMGIDPTYVKSVDIRAAVGEPVTVTLEMYANDNLRDYLLGLENINVEINDVDESNWRQIFISSDSIPPHQHRNGNDCNLSLLVRLLLGESGCI